MPGMFGRIFEACVVHEGGTPHDGLEFVRFDEKRNLLVQARVHAPID